VTRWLNSLWIGLVEECSALDVSANAADDYDVKGKVNQMDSRPPTHCSLLDLIQEPPLRIRSIHPEDGSCEIGRNFGKDSLFYEA